MFHLDEMLPVAGGRWPVDWQQHCCPHIRHNLYASSIKITCKAPQNKKPRNKAKKANAKEPSRQFVSFGKLPGGIYVWAGIGIGTGIGIAMEWNGLGMGWMDDAAPMAGYPYVYVCRLCGVCGEVKMKSRLRHA